MRAMVRRTSFTRDGFSSWLVADWKRRLKASRFSSVSCVDNWSSVWMTAVDVKFQRDEYKGFDRRDDVASVGLKVGYRFRRWLTLGAEYTYTQRDSNLPQFEYDKNLYSVTATASM